MKRTVTTTAYTAGVDTTINLQVYTKEKEIGIRINPEKQQTLYVAFEYN